MRKKTPKRSTHKKGKFLPPEHSKRKEWDGKYWFALVIAVAALILTGIQAQPKPMVSLESPLDPKNVMTTPVIISNNGMLALSDVDVICFEIHTEWEVHSEGSDNISERYEPPSGKLDPGEQKTVPLSQFNRARRRIVSSDIAMIVTFKMAIAPFWEGRKAFRFKTVRQSNGDLRFVQEPPEDALVEYDKVLKAHH